MTLRVLTYNIRKGKGGYQGKVELRAIADQVGRRDPDLFLCQEVFHGANGERGQSEELGRLLNLRHIYEPNAVYRRGNHGNATLTSLTVESFFNRNVSTNPIERRGVLYSRLIGADEQKMHVFNTHLGLNRRQRLMQINAIAEMIKTLCTDDLPIVLAGDFNDWTGALDRHIIRTCGLHNALDELHHLHRRSWPSHRPFFGLDRIYYRNIKLTDVRVHNRGPWTKLSDHLPVEACFE